MELDILYAIQSIHTEWLDKLMVLVFNTIVGDKGQIWVWVGLLAFLYPKTRKAGAGILVSYIVAYFIGDGILKDLIGRARPCQIDESVTMIVKCSSSCSCPSVHSMLAFASATAIYMNNKKIGIPVLVFAAMVGFSRMYFFVHYPSDVFLGSILGILVGILVTGLLKKTNRV